MKNRIITISLGLFWAFLCMQTAIAQFADVTFNVRVNRMEHYEGGVGGNCWETGDEEYTGYAGFSDNINTGATYTGCQTCTNNGNCTYAQGVYIGGRTNNADRIDPTVDGWEDDGTRCSHNSGDDCRTGPGDRGDIFFRLGSSPSPNYDIVGVGGFGDGDFRVWYDVQWNYAGTANLLSPTCQQQTVGYSSGSIRSWSTNLTAGRTYRFGNCGSAGDTYIRIYGSDGFTVVALNDDFCGSFGASQVDFTPSSSGTYYVEMAGFSRVALANSGTLYYEDITPAPGNPAVFGNGQWNVYGYNGGNLNLTGEYAGFYTESNLTYNTLNRWGTNGSPSDASGWQGCYVPVDNHVVVSKRTNFTCGYYQLDVPNHDDDIRVYVNGTLVWSHEPGCCDAHTNIWQGYLTASSTIEVRHLEGGGGSHQALTVTNLGTGTSVAPTSISGASTVCSGTTTTLTQVGGSLAPGAVYQWYSGSCGGTFLGNGNSITVTPSGTTTYFVRASGTCNTTPCASFAVSANTAPTISCPTSFSVNAGTNTCAANVCYPKVTGADNCAPAAPAGFGPALFFGGNYYYLSNGTDTWTGAAAACAAAGGHLAAITSAAENSFLNSNLGGTPAWIGYNDELVEGIFAWPTCEAVTYTNWGAGEPNNAGNEDYAELVPGGQWNDLPNTFTRRYFLEVEGVRIVRTAGLQNNASFPVGTTTNTFVATDEGGSQQPAPLA
jgi:Lectin C-type domain/Ig-like domain CHU_C associated